MNYILSLILSIVYLICSVLLGVALIKEIRNPETKAHQKKVSYSVGIIVLTLVAAVCIAGIHCSILLISNYYSNCPQCNTQRKDYNYCVNCGYDFNKNYECPQCHRKIKQKETYCGNCGSRLELSKEG